MYYRANIKDKSRMFAPSQIIKRWVRGKYKNYFRVKFIDRVELINKNDITIVGG